MLSTDTPVIILCGGEGTRIADVSRDAVPKPLIRIGDKPIIWHIMKTYAQWGHTHFILALGHLGWEIKNYFLNYRWIDTDFEMSIHDGEAQIRPLGGVARDNWRITFAETGAKTQTGKRIAACRKYVTGDYFMATYGDGVADIDIGALTRFALDKGKIGTVTSVMPTSRFGDLVIGDDGVVSGFAEKKNAAGGTINGGYFVFRSEFMDIAERHGDVMLEREPMDELVERGELAAYSHLGFWEPMDTMREFKQLNALWESGKAPWKTW